MNMDYKLAPLRHTYQRKYFLHTCSCKLAIFLSPSYKSLNNTVKFFSAFFTVGKNGGRLCTKKKFTVALKYEIYFSTAKRILEFFGFLDFFAFSPTVFLRLFLGFF